MSEKTIQDVFDEQRKNNYNIEEQQEEIAWGQNFLTKCLKRQKNIENKLQSLKVDLIKQKKIKFIKCDINTWRKHNEEKMLCEKYYIYYYDGQIRQEGYYEGSSQLEDFDKIHFNEFVNDYFYYGYPLYIDRNHHNSEATECELAFGSGDAYFKEFEY